MILFGRFWHCTPSQFLHKSIVWYFYCTNNKKITLRRSHAIWIVFIYISLHVHAVMLHCFTRNKSNVLRTPEMSKTYPMFFACYPSILQSKSMHQTIHIMWLDRIFFIPFRNLITLISVVVSWSIMGQFPSTRQRQ